MKTYAYSPLDTWFFRDGRPYNQGELNQAEISSQFPPPVAGMVGGLRAAVAQGQGWSGTGDWPQSIKDVLGTQNDLGNLRFSPPIIMKNCAPFFAIPSMLLGFCQADKWIFITRLCPSKPLNCDLGREVRLPIPEHEKQGLKEIGDVWLTLKGMQQVIDGGVPDLSEMVPSSALWKHEHRVGFERNHSTKAVVDGALYASSHVRLKDKVAVAVSVEGLPMEWEPTSPCGFGGEGRCAWIEPVIDPLPLPVARVEAARNGKIHYTVILNSPADIPVWPRPGESLLELPGKIVFACIGRPQRVGGWNSNTRTPVQLKPLLPPGSVWFIEADQEAQSQITELHGKHIGQRSNWGFGQIFIGAWKEGS